MTLLLHAIATAARPERPETPEAVPAGLRAQPLVRIEEAGLAAWATRFAEPAPRFGQSDLLEQHQIISRLHERLDACLPARFPTWLLDEDALRADLRRRQSELIAALDTVRGQCEIAITVLWTEPNAALPRPTAAPTGAHTGAPNEVPMAGTRYLRERQQAFANSDQHRARARALADQIERVAGADLMAVRRQVCPSNAVALSSALLAPRARATELMARLPRTQDGVRILVNGPWPPYTFAATGPWEA